MLKVTRLELEDVLLLEYPVEQDNRAIFHNLFSQEEMRKAGILSEFAEEISYHPFKKDTIYGIHFQNHPKMQAKLLYCSKGRILDYAIDLRKASPSYKKWICVELSADNKKQLFIPAGFGHAALILEDDTNIIMRIDNGFDPLLSRTILYTDPDIGIPFDIANPILSEKDRIAPRLVESDCNL